MRPLAFISLLSIAGATAAATRLAQSPATRQPAFSVVEATIPDMQRAMSEHRVTSRDLVTQYLTRIALYEKQLNAAIYVNPRALDDADRRDAERAPGTCADRCTAFRSRSRTTFTRPTCRRPAARSRSRTSSPPYDATLTKNLRDAGAVIIAKTVLTELANWVAGTPTPMPGNYSAVGGFAFNPYDPRPDPRANNDDGRPVLSTGGSSSGAGTAANFWAANVGTDTAGSVVNPAMLTMLVGMRPTTGLISRHGIIPITADQDTAGPMARTVTDAAILLSALVERHAGSRRSRRRRAARAAGSRLHEVSERRRAEGRAHRHSARVLLRPRPDRRPRRDRRAGATTATPARGAAARRPRRHRRVAGDADERGDRHPQAQRRRHRRSRQYADRDRSGSGAATSCRSTSVRA